MPAAITITRVTIELQAPGARLLVEPSLGGRLHQLFVEVAGREWPLLKSPDDPAEHRNDPLGGGCYPMAPWPNRLRDCTFEWDGIRRTVANGREHALHGLVCDRPWQLVARVGRVIEMTCALGDGWPWEGRVWQRIELGAGFLAMKMEVRAAREPFPAGCGWHPWFRRDVAGSSDARLAVPATSRYASEGKLPTGVLLPEAGDHLLNGSPLGNRRLDDCYTGFDGAGLAVIAWERLRLEMRFESPQPHLQVYTPADAVCIEPQTCAPDAFNLAATTPGTGMAVAQPGRPLALSTRWTWQAT